MAEPINDDLINEIKLMLLRVMPDSTRIDELNTMAFHIYDLILHPPKDNPDPAVKEEK